MLLLSRSAWPGCNATRSPAAIADVATMRAESDSGAATRQQFGAALRHTAPETTQMLNRTQLFPTGTQNLNKIVANQFTRAETLPSFKQAHNLSKLRLP